MHCVHGSAIRIWFAALLVIAAAAPARAQPTTGIVQGIVRLADSNAGIPYAVVSIPGLSVERFTDGAGRFRLVALAPGRYELLVRRIGFAPFRQLITVERGGTTNVEVPLVPVPVQLRSLTVQAMSRCDAPGFGEGALQPEVASLVGLLRENADRYRLLASQYPFVYQQVRALGAIPDEESPAARLRLRQVDTMVSQSAIRPDYRAGEVVRRERSPTGEEEYIMTIPSILDLADDAFARAHCFAYGGKEVRDGETWLRLNVRASDELRSPDVHGAFFLDSATSQLRSMHLELSRPGNLPPQLQSVESVRVQTRFLEIAPGLSVIESVCAVTRPRHTGRTASVELQGELQQLLSYRFRQAPEGVQAYRELPTPGWSAAAGLSRSTLWCAEQ